VRPPYPQKGNTVSKIRGLYEARMTAVEALKAAADAAEGRAFTADEQATYERTNAEVDRLDAEIRRALDEQDREDRFAALAEERGLATLRAAQTGAPDPLADEEARFSRFLKGEVRSFETVETRDLLKGTPTAGGHTVPTTLSSQIWEQIVDFSSVLSARATVLRTGSGETITLPRQTSYSTASIVAEAGAIGESEPAIDTVSLGAFKYAFASQMSRELLEDTIADVMGFFARQGGQALGSGMNAHFANGTGSGQPQGVTAAAVGKTAASASAITYDELIDLFHSIPSAPRQRASFIMRDATVALLRKIKDSTGNYIWQPAVTAGAPDTILGRPVYTDPAIPAIGAAAKSVVFGDIGGHMVRFVGPVRMERSDEVGFLNDLVTVRFIARADSRLVDTVVVRTLAHP
jgi:HK97 family phage major capsid protein